MPKHAACPANTELDLYTGCSLGCLYCIGRSSHAARVRPLLAVEATFAAMIEERRAAPFYLSPWTDAYQPLESQTGLCRRVLEALAARELPFFVITRSCLVARDLDLFAERRNAFVAVSFNTLDEAVTRRLEPDAPSPAQRCELLRSMIGRKVRTVVKVDPIIPGVTDGVPLARLLDWLCELRPHAVTLETLRLDAPLARRVACGLSRDEKDAMLAHYPALGRDEAPGHPPLSYRMQVFSRAARRLESAGVRACFCRATLPQPITAHDCRGGI